MREQGQEEAPELRERAGKHKRRTLVRRQPQRHGEDLRRRQVQRAALAERVAQAAEPLGGRERPQTFRQQPRADVRAPENHTEGPVQAVTQTA